MQPRMLRSLMLVVLLGSSLASSVHDRSGTEQSFQYLERGFSQAIAGVADASVYGGTSVPGTANVDTELAGPDQARAEDLSTDIVSPSPDVVAPDKAAQARIHARYGKLPLAFEINQGQTDEEVKFLSRGAGYTLFLTPQEAVVSLRKPVEKTETDAPGPSARPESAATETSVVRMKLAGAKANPEVSGLDPLPGKSNYLIGNDPSKWHKNVPHYTKVQYKDVYPGIDLVYYGNQRQLEYDLVVAPNADPKRIRLSFSGVDELKIDEAGNLILSAMGGEVVQEKPIVYQTIDGERREIEGRYVLKGKRQAAITIAAYDKNEPLIIDPVLVYSTYLGGSNSEVSGGPPRIAVDSQGNAYITGATTSLDFPTTAGAYDAAHNPFGNAGYTDAFVVKLNAAGTALVYSTFLGGSVQAGTRGTAIAVDNQGNAYIAGATGEGVFNIDFPVTPGAFDTQFGPNSRSDFGDAFLTKLDATGSGLVYSTFLGGSTSETPTGIAVDGQGNAYVTGVTDSGDFPITPNAFDTTIGGNSEGFVVKLNSTGSALGYGTYLGGDGADVGEGIAVDNQGNAYITGQTQSANFPTTPGAFIATFNGSNEGFITKLNATASGLVYSTFLGGNGGECGRCSISLDAAGNAYVTGTTSSIDFPVTPGAFDTTFNGIGDVFVAKLNTTGSGLLYATYLGGSESAENTGGIGVDSQGNAYVAGDTCSTDFPVLNPIQAARAGVCDAFITKLNPTGTALVYSTYLGGTTAGQQSGASYGTGVAVDALGNAYIAGWTIAVDFPVTPGAFMVNKGGGDDAFVAKISDTAAPPPPQPVLSIAPTSLNLGTVTVGTSKDLEFTVQNTGAGTLTGTASTSAPFSIVSGGSFSLSAGASQVLVIRFSPTTVSSVTGNVSFTSNGGNASQAVTGTGAAAPTITSISPTAGPVGTPVLVRGSKLGTSQGSSTLTFCNMAPQISHWEDTAIAFSVPALPAGSICTVNLSTSTASSQSSSFQVTRAVTVSGQIKSQAGVKLTDVQISITAGSASQALTTDKNGKYLSTPVPAGGVTIRPSLLGYQFTPAVQTITVFNDDITNVNFIGMPVLPKIKNVSPKQGKPGTAITITGSGFGGFDANTSKVGFGSLNANITSWSDTKIVVSAPPNLGSVLTTVRTANGTSNSAAFSYSAKDLMLLPTGDFRVLVFSEFPPVSSNASSVTQEIEIENITGTWYLVRLSRVGAVTGANLPTSEFLLGPGAKKSLGLVTFQNKAQLFINADNSIDLGSCPPCDVQTRMILGALGGEMLWRAVAGFPFPIDETDKLLALIKVSLNNGFADLSLDLGDLLVRRKISALLDIPDDIAQVLDDPVMQFLLTKYSVTVPSGFTAWLFLYGRAATVSELLIETLAYPHQGELTFKAK